MSAEVQADRAPAKPDDARELQARLYREIGISAVAAALRFTNQPEPGTRKPETHDLPRFLHDDDLAA